MDNKYLTVGGLLFNPDRTHVVLIKKNRPDYMKGLWNVVGGHVKEGESSIAAMSREFKEETTVHLANSWTLFAQLHKGRGAMIDFFTAESSWIDKCCTVTDEEVAIFKVTSLPDNRMRNLSVLIALALDTTLSRPVTLLNESYRKESA
jgi:8-oxo-dGTP diphosphatase